MVAGLTDSVPGTLGTLWAAMPLGQAIAKGDPSPPGEQEQQSQDHRRPAPGSAEEGARSPTPCFHRGPVPTCSIWSLGGRHPRSANGGDTSPSPAQLNIGLEPLHKAPVSIFLLASPAAGHPPNHPPSRWHQHPRTAALEHTSGKLGFPRLPLGRAGPPFSHRRPASG